MSGTAVVFYHRNRSDALIFDKVVEQQGLSAHRDQLWNPQINLHVERSATRR
jgi:hypothetical protein